MGNPRILHMITPMKHMSPFDVNMALDAGFDAAIPYTNVTIEDVAGLVQDAIFSRGPEGVKRTGVFIGGKRAIEAKQVAQQQAEQQRYVLQKAELEKQTAIMIAQGKSEAAKLNAEALKVQGGGLVISREWIEKWDGKLPSVYGGGQGMIIDLGSLMKDDAAR